MESGIYAERFGLTNYSEEFVDRIIEYRMNKDKELNRYLSCEEIAVKENCTADEVREILSGTAIIWTH
ncbi:MAG: hypothetical protein NC395_01480 [Prevotella sp.]|nr:hypothetical protein [Prevotella sp.]